MVQWPDIHGRRTQWSSEVQLSWGCSEPSAAGSAEILCPPSVHHSFLCILSKPSASWRLLQSNNLWKDAGEQREQTQWLLLGSTPAAISHPSFSCAYCIILTEVSWFSISESLAQTTLIHPISEQSLSDLFCLSHNKHKRGHPIWLFNCPSKESSVIAPLSDWVCGCWSKPFLTCSSYHIT